MHAPRPLLPLPLLALLLTACSFSDDRAAMAYVDPAAFRYHTCPQLDEAARTMQTRQQELDQLIRKAERDPGGHIVSVAAYRADYMTAVGSLRLIDAAVKEKNCQPPAAVDTGAR